MQLIMINSKLAHNALHFPSYKQRGVAGQKELSGQVKT